MSNAVNVIVGAGQTGAYAAMAMREAGFTGRILLIGEETERPYDRPPLSKALLIDDPEPAPNYFHAAERYPEANIEFMPGTTVTALDAKVARLTLHTGETLPYDKLLLATGGRVRRLPIPGDEHVLYLRTLDDARRIRARLVPGTRVVCIGAGVIGLEIASSARARGCTVTVLEAGPCAMGRSLTPEFAAFIERLHLKAGVELRFNALVSAVEPGRVIVDGAPLAADCVVAGIGIHRNTELATEAGLGVDHGIETDEFGRTSADNIFAAGDVSAFWHPALRRRLRLEAWKHAQNHGISVGRVMAGGTEPYDDVPWFWTDQHGINLQMAGLHDQASRIVLRGEETAPSFAAFHLDVENRVLGATGINAPREVRAALSLIRAATPVDPVALADPKTPLQRLVAASRAA